MKSEWREDTKVLSNQAEKDRNWTGLLPKGPQPEMIRVISLNSNNNGLRRAPENEDCIYINPPTISSHLFANIRAKCHYNFHHIEKFLQNPTQDYLCYIRISVRKTAVKTLVLPKKNNWLQMINLKKDLNPKSRISKILFMIRDLWFNWGNMSEKERQQNHRSPSI